MLTLAIQAGGESRRMGQDKALLPFLGRPLIQRLVDRLTPLADEILLMTGRPQDYAFLGLRCLPDLRPGRGPLGGLHAALFAAAQPLVAAVACDMPFASPDLLAYARDLLLETGADAVVPSTKKGLEPLHAVYRRNSCLPAVETALDAGELRLVSWFPQVNVRLLTPEETARCDPDGLAFWNLNTPGEFHRAEALARREKI